MEPKADAKFAIIESGGKQYKVSPGQIIHVEYIPVPEGSTLEIDKVFLVSGPEGVKVGRPYVENAKVLATVRGHGKGEKIVVFKFKSKTRYRRKRGHRQLYTELLINDIITSTKPEESEVKGDGP